MLPGASMDDVTSIIAELTDRQRLICLLVSIGATGRRIAKLLDISLRTAEHEKRHVAKLANLPTRLLVIWTVENRRELYAETQDWQSVPSDVRELIASRIK